jgi:hypothetical protein
MLDGLIIGLHLISAHSVGGMEVVTPGIYAQAENGATAGTYRNSLGRRTVYAGWTMSQGNASLSLVGATGYSGNGIPKIAPIPLASWRQELSPGVWARIGYVPPLAQNRVHTGHLMLEWRR